MITMENDLVLTTADRCDSCNAQAYFKASKDGMELLFCGHHGNKFMDNLQLQGFSVEDGRHLMETV